MDILDSQLWMIIVGFIIAFILAFGIGANDVANSFGTSVGSKVLTIRNACILATIFETLGAVLIGSKVSDTIRKGIIDIGPYENNTELLMMGNVAALSGSCVWLMAATALRLPVSGTHSIVGATIGFALVAHGFKGINLRTLLTIVGSWFVSPILAGIVSTSIFYVCKYTVLSKRNPLEPGLKLLPVFYAITIAINLFSIFIDGPSMLYLDQIPWWGTIILSIVFGLIAAVIVRLIAVPYIRTHINDHCNSIKEKNEYNKPIEVGKQACKGNYHENERLFIEQHAQQFKPNSIKDGTVILETNINTNCNTNSNTQTDTDTNTKDMNKLTPMTSIANNNGIPQKNIPNLTDSNTNNELTELEKQREEIKDTPESIKIFSFLQVLTAIFGSFAHGGNDVSNAIGPLVSLWLIGSTGTISSKSSTPIWILLYGGLGISMGLWIYGRRVIKTMGEDLTRITPSSGFCIELGSALTVLIASNIGIPISTTHCKVGSVVFVGRSRSKANVDWSVFRNIILAWLVTVPISGGISAAIMAILQSTIQ